MNDLSVIVPVFDSKSRLMMFAPHPDDESLACSVLLQQAVGAGAAIRVVYVTDGDDNPWPQRVLERKWRLNASDRKRWAKLRRAEALAALHVLGVNALAARFLALPDQKLTTILMRDCRPGLRLFAAIISDWAPTDLLVPSVFDTHPDHNALGVMIRLVLGESLSVEPAMSVWAYAVHGKSRAFFERSQSIRQSDIETAVKLRAIGCHKTQLKLSRKRFLGYAGRPERFLKLNAFEKIITDGSISSISREGESLRVKFRLPPKLLHAAEPALFVLGHNKSGVLRCAGMQIPVRSPRPELLDCGNLERLAIAQYHGGAFAGELAIPIDMFSHAHALFVKLQGRSCFFDEAGWLEVPSARPVQVKAPKREVNRQRCWVRESAKL
jgi:LmbE family N-acetylglucosaminyl deacetylase